MAIIISKKGESATKLERKNFEKETELQKYIENNPEVIPIQDMKKDAKIAIIAREFPVRTGAIDAIGIDQDGDIYIIETKLYKNTDKRYILAQILEYGAFLYKTYENGEQFVNKLNNHVTIRHRIDLQEKIANCFRITENEGSVENIVEGIKDNFDHSIFKFFVVMDIVPDSLKEVILFVNENSKFDIFPVELEYYEHEGYQILIPRLFGHIFKKDISQGTDRGRIWDEKSFFDRVEETVSDAQIKKYIEELYPFTKKYGSQEPWPKNPTKQAVFNFYINVEGKNACLFQIYYYGSIYFYLLNTEIIKILNSIGFGIPENAKEKEFKLDIFREQVTLDAFMKVIKEYVRKASRVK